MSSEITLQDSYAARRRISKAIRRTPTVASDILSGATGGDICLKLEHLQITGSFKLRGATNAVLSLTPEQRAAGVVGVSTGNHGRGLAYAAAQAVCAVSSACPNWCRKTRWTGSNPTGPRFASSGVRRTMRRSRSTSWLPTGHGHASALRPSRHHCRSKHLWHWKCWSRLPDLETVLVPLVRRRADLWRGDGDEGGQPASDPGDRRSMERGAAMYESQKAGKPVLVPELATLADSLGGGVGLDNQHTLRMTRDLVDDIVLVIRGRDRRSDPPRLLAGTPDHRRIRQRRHCRVAGGKNQGSRTLRCADLGAEY